MTPLYASPEQIQCNTITTATDIYGAGVLLYELLTGHSPYARSGDTRFIGHGVELMNNIITRDAIQPSSILSRKPRTRQTEDSTKSSPHNQTRQLMKIVEQRGEGSIRSLARKLHGDLDNIVVKSLAKTPANRYASMEAMGSDLRRYLAGEPVQARPASLSYRALKFIYRNPWPITAAASVLFFSLTLAAVMSWQAGVIRQQRDLAQAAEATAVEQRKILQRAYQGLKRESYLAAIETADDSFETGLNEFALSILEKTPVELRNWEWGWLVEPPRVLRKKRQPMQLRTVHKGGVRALYFDQRGQRMLSAGIDGQLKLWDWPTGKLLRTFKEYGWQRSPTGAKRHGIVTIVSDLRQDRFYTLTSDGRVVVRELATGRASVPADFQQRQITAIAIGGVEHEGTVLLAAGTRTGKVVLWDATRQRVTQILPGTGIPITAVAVNRVGSRIVAGQANGLTRVWAIDPKRILMTLYGHTQEITAVAISPDSTQMITGSRDHTAKVWNLETGKVVTTIVGHQEPLTAVAFSPDGKRMLTAGLDGEVKLSEVLAGKELIGLDEEHGLDAVHSVAYSPDGTTIAVGDAEGTLSWFTARPWWRSEKVTRLETSAEQDEANQESDTETDANSDTDSDDSDTDSDDEEPRNPRDQYFDDNTTDRQVYRFAENRDNK